MPLEPKLRRCEPPSCVTHIALARWVATALADRGFSAAQTAQIARVNCGWSAEAALKLTQRDGEAYVDVKECFALWETAFAHLGREPRREPPEVLTPILREVNSSSLQMLGFQMATAATIRAACDAFMAGAPLLSTSGAWTCAERDGEVTFGFEHALDARSARVFSEVVLLIFLRMLADVTDASVVPLRVSLAHERNENSLAFERAARSLVSYSAAANQVTFAALQLARPPRFEHADMHRHFAGEVKRTLDELNFEGNIVEALRKQLRHEAVLTQECLVEASSRLGISARTLQRRLQLAGTSFTDELVSVRRERALQLVAFSRRPLAKVASDLGFADRAAFSRAFRRWFDASPGTVRSSNLQKSASTWSTAAGSESPRVALGSRGA
jgi:AraC-like DNA-binding protein